MSYSKFKTLHQQESPLVLGNIWDAQSAKLAEEAGFKALGSSSHAMANLLGYADGEQISVDEILFMVERIIKVVNIPVSVDFEAGYSDNPEEVAKNVKRLTDIGVVGINLEDGKVIQGERKIQPAQLLADKIKAIKADNQNIFINARADTYTTKHENALEESISRAKIYEAAGADGIFIPLAESESDIQQIVDASNLPLNLFLTPKIGSVESLAKLGVKRISLGAKIYEWLIEKNTKAFEDYLKNPKLP